MKNYKERIVAIFKEMEEDLDLDEYIRVVGDIATDAEQTIQAAIDVRDACLEIAETVDLFIEEFSGKRYEN